MLYYEKFLVIITKFYLYSFSQKLAKLDLSRIFRLKKAYMRTKGWFLVEFDLLKQEPKNEQTAIITDSQRSL